MRCMSPPPSPHWWRWLGKWHPTLWGHQTASRIPNFPILQKPTLQHTPSIMMLSEWTITYGNLENDIITWPKCFNKSYFWNPSKAVPLEKSVQSSCPLNFLHKRLVRIPEKSTRFGNRPQCPHSQLWLLGSEAFCCEAFCNPNSVKGVTNGGVKQCKSAADSRQRRFKSAG